MSNKLPIGTTAATNGAATKTAATKVEQQTLNSSAQATSWAIATESFTHLRSTLY